MRGPAARLARVGRALPAWTLALTILASAIVAAATTLIVLALDRRRPPSPRPDPTQSWEIELDPVPPAHLAELLRP